MTARERLATAMFDGLDMDDAREGARLMVTADPHLAQDIEDGAALRRLREAVVAGWWVSVHECAGDVHLRVRDEAGVSRYSMHYPTVAQAADACREAIEAQR